MSRAAFIVSRSSVRPASIAIAAALSTVLATTGASAQRAGHAHSGGGSFGGGRPSVHFSSAGRSFGGVSRGAFGGHGMVRRPFAMGSGFHGGLSGFDRFHLSNESFLSGHGRPFSTLHARQFFPIGHFPFAYRPGFFLGIGFGFGGYDPFFPYAYPYYPYYPYDPYGPYDPYYPPAYGTPPPPQRDTYRVGERLHSPYYYCGDLNDGLFVSSSVTVAERPRHLYTPVPIYDRNGTLDGWRDLGATDYLADRNVEGADGHIRDRAEADTGLEKTLADIRDSWTKGDVEPLATHVSARREIAISMNGQWRYDLEGGDFIGLTRMALASGPGLRFQFDHVHRRADGVYAATGRHLYTDKNGAERAVYFTYVIEKRTTDYVITQVATATDRD